MNTQTIREEIKNLASLIDKGEASDSMLTDFFAKHRLYFMQGGETLTEAEYTSRFNGPYTPWSHPTGFKALVSCSCGSRDDSCAEDGPGFYSQFFVGFDGDVMRLTVQKP